jgi:hypothetical protein
MLAIMCSTNLQAVCLTYMLVFKRTLGELVSVKIYKWNDPGPYQSIPVLPDGLDQRIF